MSETDKKQAAIDPNMPQNQAEGESATEDTKPKIKRPYMTRRRLERLKSEYESLIKEAEKKAAPKKSHARFKMLSLISMISLGIGAFMVMQGKSSDLYALGTQISIGSITAILLINIFLETDD